MNIYFILFGFIILYLFKIMCNRIEGVLVCPPGCEDSDAASESCQKSVDFQTNFYRDKVSRYASGLAVCQKELEVCQKERGTSLL